MLQSKLKSYH